MNEAIKGLTNLPPLVIDHDELIGIPKHRRVGYVLKKYLSGSNVLDKTRVIGYFSEAIIGILDNFSNPTLSKYLDVFRNGISLFELNTIFTNLIKVEEEDREYLSKNDTIKIVIKENFFKSDSIYVWDNSNDQVKLIIQNISKTPKEIAEKYKLKILSKEEVNDIYSEEAIIIAQLDDMMFAIHYDIVDYMGASGYNKNRENFQFFVPFENDDGNEAYNRCIRIINILSKMAIEVFCHRINPSINYVTIDRLGHQIHTKKEVNEKIRNINYDDLVSSMRYCLDNDKKRGIAIVGDPGLGKGGRPWDKILTPTGWTTYGEVIIGDEVIGSNGKPTKVSGVFPRGKLQTYRVTFNDGSSVVVDGDHLWAVQDHVSRVRNKPYVVKETRYLASTLKKRWHIPLVKPIETNNGKLLEIDPYVMGVLIGDGSLGEHSISISKNNIELFNNIEKAIPENIKLSLITGDKCLSYRLIDLQNSKKNQILDSLRKYQLAGVKSVNKFIPDDFLYSTIENRKSLLQGLMDTDGTVDKTTKCAFYSTSSEKLKDDFVYLIESLGGVCRVSIKHPKYTYKGEVKYGVDSYVIGINLPNNIEPFRVSIKKDLYAPNEKYIPTRVIKSIEPENIEEVICIKVEAEDHLYVTEHCIVTHNTLMIHKIINDFKDVPTFIVRNEALLDVESIRRVFNLVREMKAILVFDDFDGLDVQEKGPITNEFLHQMDVNGEFKGIIIATVNDPSKVHYTLIARPERFDEVLLMRYPSSIEEIEEITSNKLKHIGQNDYMNEHKDEYYHKFIQIAIDNKFSHARISSTIDYCMSHFHGITGQKLYDSSMIMLDFQKTAKMFSANGELMDTSEKYATGNIREALIPQKKIAKRVVPITEDEDKLPSFMD